MREVEPLVLELHDGRVRGVAVARDSVDESHRTPRSHDVVAHGITHALRPAYCVCEIVLAVTLVHPRCLGEGEVIAEVELMNLAVYLRHVVLQTGDVTLAVAPYYIRCVVVVDEDGRIDACPTVL